MQAEERRRSILNRLRQASAPISATALARQFAVSRQVIVGDIALLRAGGEEISATPRGYTLLSRETGLRRQVPCYHGTAQVEAELDAMVDAHCLILDVTIDHPIYGQISAPLQLATRQDVREYLDRMEQPDARPLASLTEGIHLHTLLCPSEEAYQQVLTALRQLHLLVED